ncbi:hypothetical protein ABV409_00270 [Flagellimonas sp. DF-77]|uniref:hypothetical protein n=1 Tax=Flagellimonas algarum TaxID=3230298 RepID=UPI0033986F86
MELVIQIFLGTLAAYTILGILVSLFLVFRSVSKLDPVLANSKKSVRILLFPGMVATWPFLLKKMLKSEER